MVNGELLNGLVGVHAANSCSFVRQVFSLYQQQIPLVILKSSQEAEALPGLRLQTIHTPQNDTGWIQFDPVDFPRDDAPAQITFTSGTEGPPKAMVLSYRALWDVVHRLNDVMALDSSVREYVGIPASFSFGLGRYRACAAVGGRAYVPPQGFNPAEIASMLREGSINAISAVPTLWRMVLMNRDFFAGVGGQVRWIEIGSQYMSREEKEELKRLFPQARIVQHYGLTEASRSTFLDISATEGEALESVGSPIGDTQVQVSPEGLIQIRGPHLASGMLTPQGVRPLVDTQGWLTTKDTGQLRDGRLYYHGRADDLINCGGVKLSPETLEQKLFDALGTRQGLGVGRFSHSLRGEGVLIALDRSAGLDQAQVRARAQGILTELGLNAGDALEVMELDQLPRTETGKLRRQVLAEQYRQKMPAAPEDSSLARRPAELPETVSELEAKIISAWQRVLKKDEVSRTTTFYESGGDSLTAIGLMLALERAGVDRQTAQRIFDGETIAQIVSQEERPRSSGQAGTVTERAAADVINAVRGILVLALIAIHFLPGFLERLPLDAERVGGWLYPFYRFGTPGFALVFGLGVGYFYFHQMAGGVTNVWRRLRISAAIVLIGMIVAGLFRVGAHTLHHGALPQPLFSSTFYSVLGYYLLAVVSIPLWFRLVYRAENAILRSLVAAALSYTLYLLAHAVIGKDPLAWGVLEWIRLMLEAKYSYFRMTAIVMVGVAMGLHYRRQSDFFAAARNYLLLGGAVFLFSHLLVLDMHQGDRWWTMRDAELFSVVGYAGIVLLFVGAISGLRPRVRRDGVSGLILKILAACGILSLPSYVAHGLVIPGKDMLVYLTGVSESLGLLITLGTFVLVSILAVRKVVRLYG